MIKPTRDLELSIGGRVCGVDEVGRGCLAGPVMASAVLLPAEIPDDLLDVADSKKLSDSRRQALAAAIHRHCIVGHGEASVEEISRLNILKATFLAMERAVAALPVRPDHVLVDGNQRPRNLRIPATTVVGGDAVCLAIAAASIVAKVRRDLLMCELGTAHPAYGWHTNAGYGTPEHCAAIASAGVSPHHRPTFKGVKEWLAPPEPPQMALGL